MFQSNPDAYPVFPFFSGLAIALSVIPLSWHLQAWNAGTCLYMIWTALANLNFFVNSIVWHGNALNPAPVWCDISSRLIVGTSVAIPAASLCINRRLYKIASAQTVSVTRAQKRRAVIEDVLIGLGIPLIEMALQYVVSGHRFNIFEGIGCFPATYNVWLAYVLVGAWPVGIGLTSGVYCVLTLRSFYKRHAQFAELLASNSSLTRNRYFRLMALATVELLCTTPFAVYSIYLNATTEPVQPYISWEDTHFNYSHVDQFPATIWRLNHQLVVSLELSRWMVVVCSLVFFGFFGFADEARKQYAAAWRWVVRRTSPLRTVLPPLPRWMSRRTKGLRPLTIPSQSSFLPVFIAKPPPAARGRRDSFESSTTHVNSSGEISPSTFTLSETKLPFPDKAVEKSDDYSECYGHAL